MTGTQPRAGLRGGKPAAEVERDDLNELLRTIVEVLDVPGGADRSALLDRRASLVVATLREVLGDLPTASIPWETWHLRAKSAEDQVFEKPVPYVLTDKARLAVIHG